MKSALNLVFWGYLLVLLRFEILIEIDILLDPVGYLLIALGCFGLREHYPIAQKAGVMAVGMIFVSIPTVFVNLNEVKFFRLERLYNRSTLFTTNSRLLSILDFENHSGMIMIIRH